MKHVVLTPRQFEVAKLLSQGLRYEAIGEQLGISRRTVEHHAEMIRKKTGSATTAAAVSRARTRVLGPRSAD